MNDIQPTTWHGFAAFALESERLRAVIVPELGAKIVSLFDRRRQHEWLVPPMRTLKQTAYGDDFVSQDMSGWDEMMPTINACDYQGAHLPDHGEVWSIPWQVSVSGSKLVGTVAGRAMAYEFTRTLELTDPDCLELRYRVRNTGTEAFPYLWAAHPQFAADEQTRLSLPPEVTEMVNVIANDPAWGESGSLHAWPEATDIHGQTWQLDKVRSPEQHTCRKFYIPPEQAISWAALRHEGKHCALRLEWSAQELPYLGLWVDEGVYNSRSAAAFEPTNAYYDSLVWAVANGRVPVLEVGDVAEWRLTIRLTSSG